MQRIVKKTWPPEFEKHYRLAGEMCEDGENSDRPSVKEKIAQKKFENNQQEDKDRDDDC